MASSPIVKGLALPDTGIAVPYLHLVIDEGQAALPPLPFPSSFIPLAATQEDPQGKGVMMAERLTSLSLPMIRPHRPSVGRNVVLFQGRN